MRFLSPISHMLSNNNNKKPALPLLFLSVCLLAVFPLQGCFKRAPSPPPPPPQEPSQPSQSTARDLKIFSPPPLNASIDNVLVGVPYKIKGKWYSPKKTSRYKETGIASWYGKPFHGRKAANGEIYNMYHLTAAHQTLPLPSIVRVTNLDNNRSLLVRINDRGPFINGRIIDLSLRAAQLLDLHQKGLAPVRVELVSPSQEELQQQALALKLSCEGRLSLDKALSGYPNTLPTETDNKTQDDTEENSLLKRVGKILEELADQLENRPLSLKELLQEKAETAEYKIFVQVAALSIEKNAVTLKNFLQDKLQTPVQIMPYAVSSSRILFRVSVGPFESLEKADDILQRLIDTGYQDSIIVVRRF